jgi:hypothetical protein
MGRSWGEAPPARHAIADVTAARVQQDLTGCGVLFPARACAPAASPPGTAKRRSGLTAITAGGQHSRYGVGSNIVDVAADAHLTKADTKDLFRESRQEGIFNTSATLTVPHREPRRSSAVTTYVDASASAPSEARAHSTFFNNGAPPRSKHPLPHLNEPC